MHAIALLALLLLPIGGADDLTRFEDRMRDHGRLVVIVKEIEDGKIVVRRVNFELPQPGRSLELYAGDRVTVRVPGDDLKTNGHCIVDYTSRPDTWVLTFDEPGTLWLSTLGIRIKVRVREPMPQDPRSMALCGPGLYTWVSKPGDGEEWNRRRWIDEIADAGFNYLRAILPARAWLSGHPQSIFVRLPDGRYDLERLDEDYLRRLRADLWYARKRGVVVHLDLFDWHILRNFPEVWARSEYFGGRNTLGYPLDGEHYHYRHENAVEHPLKADWDFPPGSPNDLLQRRYATALFAAFQRVAEITPAGHIIGDGNEMEGRSASRAVLNRARKFYSLLSYGGTPLYHDPHPPETWAERNERLRRDPQIAWAAYVCLHGINAENAQERFDNIRPLLEAHPHLLVLFSTDGTGSGVVRGERGRPTFDDLLSLRGRCRQIAGIRFGGFGDIKNLGPADMRAMLEFWREHGNETN